MTRLVAHSLSRSLKALASSAAAPGLVDLDLSGCSEARDLTPIATTCTRLTRPALSGCKGLTCLGPLGASPLTPRLLNLDLSNCFTGYKHQHASCLAPLSSFTRLAHLDLSRVAVAGLPGALAPLQHCRALTQLNLSRVHMNSLDLASLSGIAPSLRVLDLTDCSRLTGLADLGPDFAASLTRLVL